MRALLLLLLATPARADLTTGGPITDACPSRAVLAHIAARELAQRSLGDSRVPGRFPQPGWAIEARFTHTGMTLIVDAATRTVLARSQVFGKSGRATVSVPRFVTLDFDNDGRDEILQELG